jgi:tetratricopeptide (TPR) repeat protein
MAKAYEITKDVAAKEKLEDLQLRRLRQALAEAEKEYRSNPSDQTKQKMVAAQKALWTKELEVYKDRVERFPNNLGFRFELGVRYQLNEMYEEAIKQYQVAQTDPRRKGVCLLNLGQCFEKIGQHRLAMKHFEDAVQEISDRDAENKKRALYSAAVLAYRLKDYRRAEQHASALAAMDYSYRNVGELLDKIAKRLEAQRGGATAEEEAVEVELPPGQDEE